MTCPTLDCGTLGAAPVKIRSCCGLGRGGRVARGGKTDVCEEKHPFCAKNDRNDKGSQWPTQKRNESVVLRTTVLGHELFLGASCTARSGLNWVALLV